MAANSSTYQGTPNGFTFNARRFRPYRGSSVKQGKGGYVKLDNGTWATCHPNAACGYSVELLGWGDTCGGPLSDYTHAEQSRLKTTL